MIRWPARLRRAAALLLGVHLLQVILLAASAVCELGEGGLPASSAPAGAVAHAVAHHEHHGGQDAPERPHHAPGTTASCPMAMACTVTALVTPVPAIVVTERLVSVERVSHHLVPPRSLLRTPEPPPPRT